MKPPWDKQHWLPGVLSINQMKILVDEHYLEGVNNFDESVDYSSIDLHLTSQGYRMINGSIKPCGEAFHNYLKHPHSELLKPNADREFKLKKNECYVFKLREKFTSKQNDVIYGQATAKSSIGRLDVIARLIVDGMYNYETMNPEDLEKGSGDMYLEIIPISFNIIVKEGISLSQIRFFYGRPENAIIREQNFIKEILHGSENGEGNLSVDVTPTSIGSSKACAFKAKTDNQKFINLSKTGVYNPCDFWSLASPNNSKRLEIKKGEFYILKSKERISLPSGVAVYCRAMDETIGEMRIHYAGFVHPFFGLNRKDDQIGTPLIFEVRGHNVDVSLNDNERLAKLTFYRMSDFTTEKMEDSNEGYNNQELTLSKYFYDWPKNGE